MAQAIRASLLASAIAATLVGRRASNAVSHVALDEACFLQALAEYTQTVRHRVRRSGVEKPDHRHRWLLRARRERP